MKNKNCKLTNVSEDKMYKLKDVKEMSFKKKIQHIWEYYRVHILGTILCLIIAVSWIYNAFLKPHKNLFAGVAVYGYKLPELTEDPVYAPLNEKLNLTGTKSEVTVEYFFADNTEAGMDAEIAGKFSALMLTGDINVLILNEEDMAFYIVEDCLLDLSKIYTEDELNSLSTQELLFESKTETVDEMKYYAINLKNSSLLSTLPNFDPSQYYIGIFAATPDEAEADCKPSIQNASRVLKALTD